MVYEMSSKLFNQIVFKMSKHSRVLTEFQNIQNNSICRHASVSFNANEDGKKMFEEVKIPVLWGHISGKWWGSKHVTPVIGLHGVQDNAGSFDRLAPLLDAPAFLALDAPGHGQSSHIPVGMSYSILDFIINLRRVVKYFNWKKISILGHSFGSAIGLVYSALYPDEVHSIISIDCPRALMAGEALEGLRRLRSIFEKTSKWDALYSVDPPAYKYDEIVNLFYEGNNGSIAKEHAIPIVNRGIKPHPKIEGAFFFARDPRLRFIDYSRPDFELQNECVANLKCHVMTLYAQNGLIIKNKNPEVPKRYLDQETILQKTAASFVRHELPGTHHLHVNNPETVAPVINSFWKSTEL